MDGMRKFVKLTPDQMKAIQAGKSEPPPIRIQPKYGIKPPPLD